MTDKTPKQLNDHGDQYFYGQGVTKNIETAFTYYKRAADLNNPIGYFNVAKYFIAKAQHKEALSYLAKAKDLGYTKANITLANLYLKGQGTRKSKKKAFKMVMEAVSGNDIDALVILGQYHQKGIGTKKSEVKAHEAYEKAAQKEHALAMFYLGSLLLEAKKIKTDDENGFYWLDKAAENGSKEAMNKLKKLYQAPHPYLKKKSRLYLDEMVFYYDELLAKSHDLDALERVSQVYFEGNTFTKVNDEKAYRYFKELHENDHTIGYMGLGLCYLYGRAVETDYKKAKQLLEIADTRGNAIAQNALGEIYRLGYGVEIDYQRAKDFYFEAAKNNDSHALINLGLLNYRKQISGAKPELAFRYMQNAVSKHNDIAYYWLGIFYDKGIGIDKDFKKAETAFKHAIAARIDGAKYKYAQLLFDHVQTIKRAKKKQPIYLDIRDLLFEYIQSKHTSSVNSTYAMYMLGELYRFEDFDLKSDKISRYYYELASENKLTKAMVRMYHILKGIESEPAINYLMEAARHPVDGESLYELANLYWEGHPLVPKDQMKAKQLYGQASQLGYQPAKEKLGML